MMLDLPHTLFNYKEKEGGVEYDPNDKAFELQRLADERALQRRRERQQREGFTIDEVFRGEAD